MRFSSRSGCGGQGSGFLPSGGAGSKSERSPPAVRGKPPERHQPNRTRAEENRRSDRVGRRYSAALEGLRVDRTDVHAHEAAVAVTEDEGFFGAETASADG